MSTIIFRDTCISTNSDSAIIDPEAPHGLVVAAREQTCGRGQRGNTWESAPGANLLFSMVLRPQHIEAAGQFLLSEAVALAVADFVSEIMVAEGSLFSVSVKWPNDIYVDDKKICGILIENTLTGRFIDKSIVGVGLNVNQREFVGDAPNPVSLLNLTGMEYDLDALLRRLVDKLLAYVSCADSPGHEEKVHEEYLGRLWRNDGLLHRWRESPSGIIVNASIVDVAANGMLTLGLDDGTCRAYAFKEVLAML